MHQKVRLSGPGTHMWYKQCANEEGMISQLRCSDFSFVVGPDDLKISAFTERIPRCGGDGRLRLSYGAPFWTGKARSSARAIQLRPRRRPCEVGSAALQR